MALTDILFDTGDPQEFIIEPYTISVGNTANSGVLTTDASTTFAFDNNKTDVFVCVAMRFTRVDAATVSSASYAGTAMIQDVTYLHQPTGNTQDLRTYIFRLQGAATGSNNVVVNINGTVAHWAAFAICAGGLSTTGQPPVTGSNGQSGGTSDDPFVTFTTTDSYGLRIDIIYHKSGAGVDLTASSGQIIDGQLGLNGGSDRALQGHTLYSTYGSKTSTYASANKDDWNMSSAFYKTYVGTPNDVVFDKDSNTKVVEEISSVQSNAGFVF